MNNFERHALFLVMVRNFAHIHTSECAVFTMLLSPSYRKMARGWVDFMVTTEDLLAEIDAWEESVKLETGLRSAGCAAPARPRRAL